MTDSSEPMSREQVLAVLSFNQLHRARAAVAALYYDNERMGNEIVESAQIVGKALAGKASLHIGHLPDMCRDLVAERDRYKRNDELQMQRAIKAEAERDALRRAVESKNEAMKAVAKYLGYQKFGAYVGTLQNAINYTGTNTSDAEGGVMAGTNRTTSGAIGQP